MRNPSVREVQDAIAVLRQWATNDSSNCPDWGRAVVCALSETTERILAARDSGGDVEGEAKGAK